MAKFKSTASSGASPVKPTAARKPAAKRAPAAEHAAPARKKKPASLAESAPRGIMDSAQQIWQTGVKALGRAQQESTRLFEALVKEGVNVEKKTRSLASGKVNAVRDSVENRVEQVKDRAADTWDRLEKVFEERVQRALVRLGVPGRDELQSLIQRVDQLNARLRDLAQTPAPKAAKPEAKPAAKAAPAKKPASAKAAKPAGKPATKTAVAKKAASAPRKPATEAEAAPAAESAPSDQA